jgi:cellulose synthase operon protein C
MAGLKFQGLGAALRALSELLSSVEFEPLARRSGGGDARPGQLAAPVQRVLLELDREPAFSTAPEGELADEELQVRGAAARSLGQAAAVLIAAGDDSSARSWLERARELLPLSADRDVFDEGLHTPELFRLLMQADWRYEQGDFRQTRKLSERVLRSAPENSAIRSVAEGLRQVHAPLQGAPALFSLNGFGTRIYGSRDRRQDGSYVGTRYVTALFIPVLPLDAFHMADAAAGSHSFYARAPLSRVARLWQWTASIALVLAAAGGGVYAYLHSDGYELGRSLAAAAAQEGQAHTLTTREAALVQYETLIERASEQEPEDLVPAALGIARLLDAGVPRPFDPAGVDGATKALQRFASIPPQTRAGEPTEHLCRSMQSFATALEGQGTAGLHGARRLLAKAHRLCGASVAPALRRVRLSLARLDAKDWPLVALADYAQAFDAPEAVAESSKLIDAIGDDEVSIWHELEPSLSSWLQAAQAQPDQAVRVARVKQRLEHASTYFGSAARRALDQDPKPEQLSKALDAEPGDQQLRVALSSRDSDVVALTAFAKFGPPGKMIRSTARAFAELLQRLGKLEESEAALERLVQQMLPEYEDARSNYSEAVSALYSRWYERARASNLPEDITSELNSATEAQAPALFDKWISKQAESDAEVQRLFESVQQKSEVVPIVLSLGTVKLLRAAQVTGQEQARLLAAAERLFLSIRSDAAGVPAYHLGLAQVYYRLGKTSEGESEFGAILAKKDADLDLSVARAYREVGAITRARQVTEAVHEKAGSPQREGAALLMSLMADTQDDRRTWLLRSDQNNEHVRINLLELEADKACSGGQTEDGDAKYREVARRHLEGSALEESNFNNAALAQAARVACSGQRAALDEALQLMHRALRIAPDSSLLAQNAAPLHTYRAGLRALSRWLDPSALRLDAGDADTLLDALAEGPHRDELLAMLKEDADVKRARELTRSARVLAPGQAESYFAEVAWLKRFEDGPGLLAMLSTVRAQKLDTGPIVAARQQWLDGKLDTSRRERLHKEEAKLERISAALPGSQPASLAALRYLEGELSTTLLDLDEPLPRAEQAVRAFAAADELWPAIGARRRLGQALLVSAAVRASTSVPALAARLRKDLREYGWHLTLCRLADESDAPTLGAVTAQAEFARALEIARSRGSDEPDTWDWLMARLAGDAASAENMAARVFDEKLRTASQLSQLLAPGKAADAYISFSERHTPKAQPSP